MNQNKMQIGDNVKIVRTDNDTAMFENKLGRIERMEEASQPNIGIKIPGNDWIVYFYTNEIEVIVS
jgi:hypothetical protein